MTSRERLLTVMSGKIPDCVPCCPDISNMIPCRLTGKPFWDIYACKNPPLWQAHINALNYFDIDGGFEICGLGDVLDATPPDWEERVIHRFEDGSFVTRKYYPSAGRWEKTVIVYTADNPRAYDVSPENMGLPAIPTEWEPLTGVKEWPSGLELWYQVRAYLGDRGVMGIDSGISTCLLHSVEDVYAYYDNPEPFRQKSRILLENLETRMETIARMNPRPDYLDCGCSGSLIFQTPEMLRELSLPLLQRAAAMASDLGIATHVHSCGPEKALVAMAAEETQLTIIDPLETAPHGDCVLKELKQRYGHKLVLKGNLHTTDVMLNGSVDKVIRAAKKAIDDAAAGGRFILSTGDQCGRDTPEENIFAMIETARTYGRY